MGGASAADAGDERGGRVAHATHRGAGEAGPACRAIGGDDRHRSRQAGQRRAKFGCRDGLGKRAARQGCGCGNDVVCGRAARHHQARLRPAAPLYYSPMDMIAIPSGYPGEIDLHHLQVFEVLLRERSLTRAARVLGVTQPALSKTLARLRRYFDDPLFVRVSLRMEPTSKALSLESSVRTVLDGMRTLRTQNVPFDPKTSNR